MGLLKGLQPENASGDVRGGSIAQQIQQAPHHDADRQLVRDDDASMYASPLYPIVMELDEVSHIERDHGSTARGGVFELLSIREAPPLHIVGALHVILPQS
jgi:hypothetical protein